MYQLIPLGVGAVFATAAIVTGPVILPWIGFTKAGIAAGSAAASFMSFVYTKGVGMAVLSAAQSAGALGTVGAAKVAATGALGYVVTAAVQLIK